MTISYAQVIGVDDRQRNVPNSIPPVIVPSPNTWTRPSDWAALPAIGPSDQKFAGIYAVWDNDTGYVALLATTSTGDYQVDWGDGSSPTTHTSNTQAQYQYDYSTISGSPTTRGYKTVCITVTAVSGNLTGINLDRKYTNTPALSTLSNGWLDVYLGSPNFTTIQIGSTTPNTYPYYLERCRIVSWNLTATNSMFQECRELVVVELPSMANVTNTTSMFLRCHSLQTVPNMTLSNVTSAGTMFSTCYSLISVPELNFHPSSNVNLNGIFNSCYSLEIAPKMTGQITDLGNAFIGCASLRSVDGIETKNVSNLSRTFESCGSLQNIPIFNTINVTNFSGTFAASGLINFPALDMSNGTNFSAMFNLVSTLETLPSTINIPKATSTERMFNGCVSIKNVNLITTGNLTAANSMFTSCNLLTTLANFDTSNVTNASGMFSACNSLIELPLIDTSKVTNARLMFNGCSSLSTIPAIDLGNATNCALLFSNCFSLLTVPNVNTVKATDFTQAFNNCFSLTTGPNIPTSNCNLFSQMFFACGSLMDIPTYDTANGTSMNFMFSECQTLQNVPNISTVKVTNVNSMFNFCRSLSSVPAFDLSNVTNAGTFIANTAIGKATVTNIKANITFTSSLLNKTNIENIFSNLVGGNATARSITVTSNPGNDTVVTKSSNTTSGSNVVVIANTVGLSTGMLVTGNNISNGRAVTFQDTGDTVTLNNHGIADNTIVSFSTITSTTGITVYTPYYVVNSLTNTFQVANSQGGSALALTTNGNGTLLYGTFIDTINGNANIIVSVPASGTANNQTLTFSVLNTSIATLKNWSVTR